MGTGRRASQGGASGKKNNLPALSVGHQKIVWIKHYNKQSSKMYTTVEGQEM